MRPLATLVVVITLLGLTGTADLGHAEPNTKKGSEGSKTRHATRDADAPAHAPATKESHPPAPKDSHGSTVTPATLKPPTHRLSSPSAAHPTPDEPPSRSPKAADAPDEASRTQSTRTRPPNPALEAVLQRLNRRMSTARSAERTSATPTAARERSGGSTVKPTHAAAAAAPTFRAQVTAAPQPPEPSDTPRVRLTWRPTVIWPRSVLPGGDADARVQVEWSH
jgi:hypothetical protein